MLGYIFVFMIVIRFSRVGRKNKPQFRIVVQDNKTAPTGGHIEILGSWDPHQKQGVFKNERIQYWLSQGAQASDSVHNLLVAQKVIEAKKRVIKMKKVEAEKKEGEETPVVAEKKEEAVTPAVEVKKEEVSVEEKKMETPTTEETPKA
jgi:small subunit ribosomal protein S16